MAEAHVYHTSVRWQSQRKGSLSAGELPQLTVATPPEFPGGHPGLWSPEHLFVAAAEACIMTTFLAIAENSRLEFKEYSSEAEGTLEKTESGYMFTRIVVRPRLVIAEERVKDRAERILQKSEQQCLISRSMKCTVSLEPEVVVG